MNGLPWLSTVLCMALATAQSERAEESTRRCRALAAAQDAGQLSVEAAVAALADADEAVARTAAAIVRHEWQTLSVDLFSALDRRPPAARMLLRELAQAPRLSAAAWAERWSMVAPGRSLDDRCMALAARGVPLVATEAELWLRALLQEGQGDGVLSAAAVLSPKVADGLLGRVHAALQQGGVQVEQLSPWLDRLSADGVRRLLGLALTLPPEAAATCCQLVQEREPALVAERARAALDAEAPIDALWLPFAGPELDQPARVGKVQALLFDDDVAAATKEAAFTALLAARAINPAVLRWSAGVERGHDARARRLLDVGIDLLPTATLIEWIDSPLGTWVVRALARRAVLDSSLEQLLVTRLLEAGSADGEFCAPAAMAIVAHGSAEGLRQVWALLRDSRSWPEFVDGLARRRAPFVHEFLLAELQANVPEVEPAARAVQLDAVAMALVTLGDRRELQRLVTAAKTAAPGLVRRYAHHARPLDAKSAQQLLALLPTTAEPEVAAEILEWAATAAADATVLAQLQALWQRPDAPEQLREVALRALAASAHRPVLVARLREVIAAGPVPEDLAPLPFELLASMPTSLVADDVALCADFVLLMPRTDPEREAKLAAKWPDGTFGFPLVAASAQVLRRADANMVGAAFRAAVAVARADARQVTISHQRLLVLWRELAMAPLVQHEVAVATAELALALPGAANRGPAHWFAMQAAVVRADFATARRHAEGARAALLRLPEQRRHARLFLGERDPNGGVDPWAALSAMPHVLSMQDAAARGDDAAVRAAATLLLEFAGHDAGTLATSRHSLPELVR